MRIQIILFAALLISGKVFSQPVEEWLQRYNGPANSFDIVSKMEVDERGNVYVYGSSNGVGSSTDFAIIKYDADGDIKWIQRYDGPGNSTDQLISACPDNYGNSYITGFSTDSNFANNITTVKYDSSGILIWIQVYRRNGYSNSFGQDIAYDNYGNIYVCGFLRNSQSTYDIVTIKYSNNGNEIRSVVYNGEGNGDDIPVVMKIDNSNNIILSGTTKTLSSASDIIIIKYDSSLTLNWKKTFNGSANTDDGASAIAVDDENNIYLCGNIYNNQSSSDYLYAKLNSTGTIQWNGIYNGTGNSLDIPSSIEIDVNKNIFITGFSRSGATIGTEDILTLKVSPAGVIVWTARYDGIAHGIDQGTCLTFDNNGNIYVGGASDRGNIQLTYALLKYNSYGMLDWFKNYSLVNIPEDFITSVALDKSKNIYVTGISLDTVNDYDIVTIKYSQTVGISNLSNEIPADFFLHQNYPNPFNPVTKINFSIPQEVRGETQDVRLVVFDIIGRELVTLVNQELNPGRYSVVWNAENFSSGVYFYVLKAGDYFDTKKMILTN